MFVSSRSIAYCYGYSVKNILIYTVVSFYGVILAVGVLIYDHKINNNNQQ